MAVALYTHNWPIFFTVSAARRVGAAVVARGQAAPRASCCATACSASAACSILYLPWVPTTLYQAAHTGAPWADAPAFSSLLGVPGVLLGRMPQIVLLICAGAGLVTLLRRAARASTAASAAALIILAVLTPTIAWTMSQASPAWANRYLAVALPPFLLLAAGGLAYARRLGIVGLVLVVIMWAQDAAPVEKSNVRAVAHEHRPEPRARRPRDLHAARDDPGPALLPAGWPALRDADRRAERGRRLGLARRRRAAGGAPRAERDLKPVIDAMPVGSRIVLVEPITWTLNRWRAPWTKLVRIRSKEWAQYLSNDPRLKVSSIQPTNFTPPRPNPVQATVMVKTG